MSELGRGVDPFEIGLLQCFPLHVGDQGFSQGQDALLWSDAAAVEHDEVVLHFAVVGESTLIESNWSVKFLNLNTTNIIF